MFYLKFILFQFLNFIKKLNKTFHKRDYLYVSKKKNSTIYLTINMSIYLYFIYMSIYI